MAVAGTLLFPAHINCLRVFSCEANRYKMAFTLSLPASRNFLNLNAFWIRYLKLLHKKMYLQEASFPAGFRNYDPVIHLNK